MVEYGLEMVVKQPFISRKFWWSVSNTCFLSWKIGNEIKRNHCKIENYVGISHATYLLHTSSRSPRSQVMAYYSGQMNDDGQPRKVWRIRLKSFQGLLISNYVNMFLYFLSPPTSLDKHILVHIKRKQNCRFLNYLSNHSKVIYFIPNSSKRIMRC